LFTTDKQLARLLNKTLVLECAFSGLSCLVLELGSGAWYIYDPKEELRLETFRRHDRSARTVRTPSGYRPLGVFAAAPGKIQIEWRHFVVVVTAPLFKQHRALLDPQQW